MTDPKSLRQNNETITLDDLKAGIAKLNIPAFAIDAAVLFKAALESREHWEDGDIVRSYSGNIFKRLSNGNWQNMTGRAANTNSTPDIITDRSITRPLTLIGKAVLW